MIFFFRRKTIDIVLIDIEQLTSNEVIKEISDERNECRRWGGNDSDGWRSWATAAVVREPPGVHTTFKTGEQNPD